MATRSFHGVRVVRFGEFELDVRSGELRQGERKIRLQDQPRRILAMLLEHPGEVVLREEICKRLWPNGTVVEVPHGINAAVLRLRDALGDSAENPRFVETVARRGYRFLAPVEVDFRRVPSLRGDSPPALNTEALAGQSLSHFRLEEKLGRGGMGVVYRAEDLSLGRPVALKFLAAEMAGDLTAVSRFQREARLASALNHPNICTVYAVEECAGQPVIVMELLEGRTLEAMLTGGPVPADQALQLAIQMATALDAAHRKRIVHRDLKPGNVMVMGSCLKVLDFGLAKQSLAGGPRPAPEVTHADSILGTPTYMAPEQFQGKEADARSDLYSFGLVLLEMLTGCRAADDPKRSLPAAAADLEPVLRRALEANPADRWQTAHDLKAALERVAVERISRPPVPEAAASPPAPSRQRVLFIRDWKPAAAGFAAAVLAIAGLAYWNGLWPGARQWKTERASKVGALVRGPAGPSGFQPTRPAPNTGQPGEPAAPAPSRLVLPQSQGGPQLTGQPPKAIGLSQTGPASSGRLSLSPDGKLLAFSSGGQVFVRTIAGEETRLIATDLGTAGTPFWSPDGRSVAFTQNGWLLTVSARGGPAKPVAEAKTNLAGAWGPDGTILIGVVGDGLVAIPSSGGASRLVTKPDSSRGETRDLLPQFLPGGRRFLFTSGSNKAGQGTLYAGSLDSADRVAILHIDSGASFVRRVDAKGYLVFGRGGYLMAQAFDAAALHTEGDAFPLAGPMGGSPALSATAITVGEFSATPSTLVYRSTAGPKSMFSTVAMASDKSNDAAKGSGLIVLRNWMPALPR